MVDKIIHMHESIYYDKCKKDMIQKGYRCIKEQYIKGKYICGIWEKPYVKVKPIRTKKNCSNCANNIEYPPPHTCDECDSLDNKERGFPEHCMWEYKKSNDGMYDGNEQKIKSEKYGCDGICNRCFIGEERPCEKL